MAALPASPGRYFPTLGLWHPLGLCDQLVERLTKVWNPLVRALGLTA
jgi:hypothetical protein